MSKVLIETKRFTATLKGESGVEQISGSIKARLNEVTRIAKKEMVRAIRKRLKKGVPMATYTRRYAKFKSQTRPRSYTAGGPVDLRYSGQLLNNLRGRGRARPAQGDTRIWLGFERQTRTGRRRSTGAERLSGGNLRNERLKQILNGKVPSAMNKAKLDHKGRPPIALHGDELQPLIKKTISTLIRKSKKKG